MEPLTTMSIPLFKIAEKNDLYVQISEWDSVRAIGLDRKKGLEDRGAKG